MSRVGNKPIPVPDGIKVGLSGLQVTVEGPKGRLSWTHHELVSVRMDEATKCLIVDRANDQRLARSLHGTTRSLIAHMIEGVSTGYRRDLELYGVGYSASIQGKALHLMCGFSTPVVMVIPDDVTVEITTPQARGDTEPARFGVTGCDKQAVGEFAAECRNARKAEPYKGKGLRYAGERITRKVGKAFAGGAA